MTASDKFVHRARPSGKLCSFHGRLLQSRRKCSKRWETLSSFHSIKVIINVVVELPRQGGNGNFRCSICDYLCCLFRSVYTYSHSSSQLLAFPFLRYASFDWVFVLISQWGFGWTYDGRVAAPSFT